MKKLKTLGVLTLAALGIFLFSYCTDDGPAGPPVPCDNPDHIGLSITDSIAPYESIISWTPVPEADSFCVTLTWNTEVIIDTIVANSPLDIPPYDYLPGDTLVVCIASYCNGECNPFAICDTISFGNGIVDDVIVFYVPPAGDFFDMFCTNPTNCSHLYFEGSTAVFMTQTYTIPSQYQNYTYPKNSFCNILSGNDDLIKTIQTSPKDIYTAIAPKCN